MYNTYTSSVLWSIRIRGSVPDSFGDYSCLLDERFGASQVASSLLRRRCACSCCCSCKSLTAGSVPVNPSSFLYGLRQSTLIQWSPFRRRSVFRGGDRFVCRLLVYDLEDDSVSHSYSVRDRYVSKSTGQRRKKGHRCWVSEDTYKTYGIDDADAVISLLSEECSCEGKRKEASARAVEREKKKKYGSERYEGSHKRDEVNRSEDQREYYAGKKNQLRSSFSAKDSGHGCKSITIKSDERKNGEKEEHSVGETRRGRKSSSSSSTYYSLSSGQPESDVEDQMNDARYIEGSLDSRRRQENESAMSSIYHRRYDDQEGKSDLALNMGPRRQKRSRARQSYKGEADIHEIHVDDNVDMTSQHQERFSGRDKSAIVSDGGASDRDYIREKAHEKPQIPLAGVERTSQVQRHFGSRQKIHQEGMDVIESSVQGVREQRHQSQKRVNELSDLRIRTDRYSNSSVHDHNRRASTLQSEIQKKNREEKMSIISSSQQIKEQPHNIRGPDKRIPSRVGSVDATSVPVSQSSDAVRIAESRRTSVNRIVEEENIPMGQPWGETRERQRPSQTNEKMVQINLPKESQEAYGLYRSPDEIPEKASTSQASSAFSSKNRFQQVNVDEEIVSSQTTLLAPPSQLARRGSQINSQGTSGETHRTSYHAANTQPDTATPASSSWTCGDDYGHGSPGVPSSFTMHEDALGSAQRSDQVSTQLIGEFVEKAKFEISASETEKQQRADAKLESEVEKSTAQYTSEKSQLKQRGSSQSSGGDGAKGPSDEMWVTDTSVHHTPEADAPDSSSAPENAVVKRTGRSLWTIIGDVFRLRWAFHGGASSAAVKSGGKSSSGESVSTEAWFSGREHDESSDENFRKGKRVPSREIASSRQQQVISQGESSGSIRLKDKREHHETELLSSSSKVEDGSGSSSRLLTTVSGGENFGTNGGGSFHGPLSGTELVEPSLHLQARGLRRSPIVREISEKDRTGGSGNLTEQMERPEIGMSPKNLGSVSRDGTLKQRKVHDFLEDGSSSHDHVPKTDVEPSNQVTSSHISNQVTSVEQPRIGRSAEESGSPSKDDVLKRKKLYRTKQVLRDRFDEWEEAYQREAEQRRIDEMFMREALIEAKKAADFWEVPVGAVLVQEGKIIARGYNLVEELRDSTAHAEMICIREASNILRSWRLADTTLYVTLEPCPMCAGAILQARINTLVWGAPNKLLGADGSWIRLFPEGEGSGSESSDKPPAPVHPFHPKMMIRRSVLASECADAMQQFFQLRRKKKVKDVEPQTPAVDTHVSHHPSKILAKMHDIFHILFCL